MAKESWITRNQRKKRTVAKYAKLRAKLKAELFPPFPHVPDHFPRNGFERSHSRSDEIELVIGASLPLTEGAKSEGLRFFVFRFDRAPIHG